jgi:hypothetical protein
LLLCIISRCGFSEREPGYLCRSILDSDVATAVLGHASEICSEII